MIVLEFKLNNGSYASVTRQKDTDSKAVSYKVELWDLNRFYHSKTFNNFEKAELYYWKKLVEELL
jgi:hypothetical protein